MKVVINTGESPSQSLVENQDSFKILQAPAIVYGDILLLEIYPMLDLDLLNEWAGIATLKVGVGNHGTSEVYLPAVTATWQGDHYSALLDLTGDAFEELTRGKEKAEVEIEIQVSGAGFTQTIYQKKYELRNQLIGARQIVLDPPLAPSEVVVVDLGIPHSIHDLVVLARPVAPTEVRVGANEFVLPLAPSDVVSVMISGIPLAPSDVDVSKLGGPLAIEWIEVGVLPIAPSDAEAELLTPVAPSELNVVNLFSIPPLPAIAGDIDSIPLEPSEFRLMSSPVAPSHVVLDLGANANVSEIQVWNYNARPAGLFFGEPSDVRARELFIAGDNSATDRGHVPTEVSAVLYDQRLPAHPYEAILDLQVGAEPEAPSQVGASLTSLTAITVLPQGSMEPEVKLNSGQVLSAGTYFRTYYDSSGSMNAIIPAVRNGITNLRTYLSTVLYDNSSEATQYISPASAFSHERWMRTAKGAGNQSQKEVNVIFINESQSIYHSSGILSRAASITDRNEYITYYANKTKTHHSYIIGYLWTSGSWKSVTREFEDHLDYHIYKHSNPLTSHGIKGYMDWDSNAGTDASVQFLINYLNIPQQPTDIDMTVVVRNLNAHEDRWEFTTDTTIKGLAGTYNGAYTNKVAYTQDRWEMDISTDGGATVATTTSFGATVPSHIEIQGTQYATAELSIRIRAVGVTGYQSKESSWVTNGRLPAEVTDVTAT